MAPGCPGNAVFIERSLLSEFALLRFLFPTPFEHTGSNGRGSETKNIRSDMAKKEPGTRESARPKEHPQAARRLPLAAVEESVGDGKI